MNSLTPLSSEATVAASYERVSTRAQGLTGFSLGAQAKDTAQFATEQAWFLPEHLRFRDGEDRDASGADWDLPGLNAMLDAARKREFTVLVVPAVDRFARNMAKALVLEEQLRKYGVRVVYLASPVDDTPEGRLQVHVQHVFAEYDRDKRRFQSMRGRREKIERGQVAGNGPAPYGYRYVREGLRNRVVGLEQDPLTVPIVQRIFSEALRRSAADIADTLQAEGVPAPRGYNRRDPGRRWAPDIVLRILSHPVYAGKMIYGAGEGRARAQAIDEVKGMVRVPAIIDEALWSDVQDALRRRKSARKARRGGDDPWLLRGLLVCDYCGGLLSVVNNWSRSTGAYRQYRCLRSQPAFVRRSGDPVCPMRDLRAEHTEALVWNIVREALLDPERLNAGLESACAEHEEALQLGPTGLMPSTASLPVNEASLVASLTNCWKPLREPKVTARWLNASDELRTL